MKREAATDKRQKAGGKRFRFGVCEWSVRARGKALCRMAAEAGLDCLQLGVGEEVLAGEGLGSPSLVREYLEAGREYGIQIDSLSPQFVDQYSFTMPQSTREEQLAVSLCERTIDLCGTFGCRSFLLPVLCRNDICDEASFQRAAKYIGYFGRRAAQKGIETHLELNQSVAQVYRLLEVVDNPMVRLFFDSQNLYVKDGTCMASYFVQLQDRIGGIHLKDGREGELSGSLLGEGASGFFETAAAILGSSYQGSLIIESVYDKPEVRMRGTEEELLERDAETLRRVFGSARQRDGVRRSDLRGDGDRKENG